MAQKYAQYKHSELTGKILNAFYHVYNTLGYGFLERVYENALAHELRKRGHRVQQQAPIHVLYDGVVVGEYFADLLVDDTIILELKAVADLLEEHENQLTNYLKASMIEVGLVLNFGPQPKAVRRIYDL